MAAGHQVAKPKLAVCDAHKESSAAILNGGTQRRLAKEDNAAFCIPADLHVKSLDIRRCCAFALGQPDPLSAAPAGMAGLVQKGLGLQGHASRRADIASKMNDPFVCSGCNSA